MGDVSDFSDDESAVSASNSIAVSMRAQHLAIRAMSSVDGPDASSVRAARALAEWHAEDSLSLQRPQSAAREPAPAEDVVSDGLLELLRAQEASVAAL